jgi:hypothetical protein
MRMQITQPSLTDARFVFVCCNCGIQSDNTEGYGADLDGEPFKAYYCLLCGNAQRILHDRTKGAAQS